MMSEEIVKHNSNPEARTHFLDEVEKKLADTEQWMGVLFRIVDGKIELGIRTTYGFPINDCLAAIGLLCANLHVEALKVKDLPEPVRMPPPLPRCGVSKVKPFVNVPVGTDGNKFGQAGCPKRPYSPSDIPLKPPQSVENPSGDAPPEGKDAPPLTDEEDTA